MSVPHGYRRDAQLHLRELSKHLNSSHRELETLRAAGVGEQRISTLYPLDWNDWREAAEQLSESAGYFERNGTMLLSRSTMEDVATCIPPEAMGGDADRIQTLVNSWMGNSPYHVARLARLELAVRLLHVLAGNPFELVHPNRASTFRMRTDDLLEDARVFCLQLNELTELFEDSSF